MFRITPRSYSILTACLLLGVLANLCSSGWAYPLLEPESIKRKTYLATITDREELIQKQLETLGFSGEENQRLTKLLLEYDSEESMKWAQDIIGSSDIAPEKELVARVIELQNAMPEADTLKTLEVVKGHELPEWYDQSVLLRMATRELKLSLSEDLPCWEVSDEVAALLEKGIEGPLEEEDLQEVKSRIENWDLGPNNTGLGLLVELYLTQKYDEDLLYDLLDGKVHPIGKGYFYYSMGWQVSSKYVDFFLARIQEWSRQHPTLSEEEKDDMRMYRDVLRRNNDNEQVQAFLVDLLAENPGRFYPYLDQVADALPELDHSTGEARTLRRQANRLTEAASLIYEKAQ